MKRRIYEQTIRDKLGNMLNKKPNGYWKLWNSLAPVTLNNLTLNDQNAYVRSQVEPPFVKLFDQEHMKEIESFASKYINSSAVTQIVQEIHYDICNAPISSEEIDIHINRLKNDKTAGVDWIAGECLKYAASELNEPLQVIFNHVFEKGDFPSLCIIHPIHPIHKKGSQNIADNYRKITIMSVIGNVFESIMNSRLKHRNIILEINDENQFGFKGNCRTTDNMFILRSLIERQKFKKKPLYICFVDFTKAFD